MKVSDALTGALLWEGVVLETGFGADVRFSTNGPGQHGPNDIILPTDGFFVLSFSSFSSTCIPPLAPSSTPPIHYAWAAGGAGRALGSFYYPVPSVTPGEGGGYVDTDFLLKVGPSGFELDVRSHAWNGGTLPDLTAHLGEEGWTLPYDAPALCAATPAGCVSSPSGWQFIAAGVQVQPMPGGGERLLPDHTFRGTVDIPTTWPAQTWTTDDLALRFRPATRLNVLGTLNATDVTMTALEPADGWLGVRYNANSSGSLTDVTVERVGQPWTGEAPWTGSAITITNASPSLANVTIQSPASPNSGGVRVNGANAVPMIRDLHAEGLTGNAVQVTGGARTDLVRGELLTNAGGVVASGVKVDGQESAQTIVYFVPDFDVTGGDYRGPIITGSTGQGVSATTSAEIRFGAPTSPVHGYARVIDNEGRGMNAGSGAALYAGTATVYQRNSIFDNGGTSATGNVRATGAGSRAYVECNWWNTATPTNADFRTGQTNGGTLVLTAYLTANPVTVSNPPCVSINITEDSRLAGTAFSAATESSALRRDSTMTARLLAAVEATPAVALAALTELVADAPESEEAAAAVGEIGSLAGRENGPDGARAALGALSGHTLAPLRVAAWQALVVSRAATGDAAGALAATDALIAEGAVVPAEAARVSLHAAMGDTTAAVTALERLEAAAPGSVEAAVARATLGMGPDPFADDLRETMPETMYARSGASPASAALRVAPNPASTLATITLSLDAPSEVHITVHDLLGRVVAVVAGGVLEAGEHRADVPVSSLAPGVYVVRAVAGGAVQTTRLTVAR